MAGDLSTAIELSDGGDLQASFVPFSPVIKDELTAASFVRTVRYGVRQPELHMFCG